VPACRPTYAPADAEAVAQQLQAAGYPCACLSAQRTQLQRIEAINALRDFRCVADASLTGCKRWPGQQLCSSLFSQAASSRLLCACLAVPSHARPAADLTC
jgi:hypothetical protein